MKLLSSLRRPLSPRPSLWAALACLALLWSGPAQPQVQAGLGLARSFPEAALRGTLTFHTPSETTLNGRSVRLAPGMRLFSPQNTLVLAHTVTGQSFVVNYLLETSTGMLQSAWILTEAEAQQTRRGSDAVERNYRSQYDAVRP